MAKKQKEIDDMPDKLAFEPPEPGYVTERYVISLPVNNEHLKDPWKLRLYASQLVNRKIGDEVQLTGMKIKQPGRLAKAWAKLLGRVPNVHLYVTTKF